MLVLGVDPGSKITGYGIIDSESNRISYNSIKPSVKLSLEDKIYKIFLEIKKIIKEYKVDEMAIETPFYSVNIKSAMILSEIKASVIIAAKENGIKVYPYSPREVKQSVCGYGAATKEQVKFIVEKTLKLDLKNEPFDVSDALAVTLTHIYAKRF